VEDEKILADSMALYLGRHAYATAVAYAGEESLQLAEENSPDVMVVDIHLPGIDGLEVLRRIREASPSTEVVMITAYASIATAVEAMKRGAFHYLSKPLDLVDLCAVVAKALTNGPTRQGLSSS
jgi:DNA-binding NtrC family response regulator